MRLNYLIALLLGACSAQTNTSPRVVKFDDAFVGYTPIIKNRDWKTLEVKVFDQPNQRISFRHRLCPEEGEFVSAIFKTTDDGNWIIGTRTIDIFRDDNGYEIETPVRTDLTQPLFSIEKLGPNTPEDYMRMIENRSGLDALHRPCKIKKIKKYIWRLDAKDEVNNFCKVFGFQYYAIKGGIVIGYPAPSLANNYIDPQSITYSNSG